MMIEFCCDPNSNMGVVGKQLGIVICRMAKETFDLSKPAVILQLLDFVKDHPGISLWGSLPCTAWCSWQHMSVYKHGEAYEKKLRGRRAASMRLFSDFVRVATEVRKGGGDVSFEWQDGLSHKSPGSSTTSASTRPSAMAAPSA